MKQRTIWVVEDNPAYARAIGYQLKAMGVNAYIQDNVSKISPLEGDIVLLDLMGTDSSAIEFGAGVTIFTMSACPDFNPNFVKPLSQSTLRKLVDSSLGDNKTSENKAQLSIESLRNKYSSAS